MKCNINENPKSEPDISDSILSEGELLSTRILDKILTHDGKDCKVIDLKNDDFPILTEKVNGIVKIDLEKTKSKINKIIKPLIEEKIIPIIPGFVGKTKDGKITTLERGGSDTTAVLVGSLLKLPEVVLLKDVPGILRCDPQIKKSEKVIEKIGAERAMELGVNGGEVINPDALRYKNKNTDVRIVDYKDDEFLKSGTKITGKIETPPEIEMSESKALISIILDFQNHDINGDINILEEEDIGEICRFRSDEFLSICVDEDILTKIVEIIHERIIEKNKGIVTGQKKDVCLIKIKLNHLLDYSKFFHELHQGFFENSIDIIHSKFNSNRLYLVINKEDLDKTKNILKVIK